MANPVETWKAAKHGLDVWEDIERYAESRTPMKEIDSSDLERMKWHGFFYRKRDKPGRYMNRIRITANELSAKQAKEIAYIAYEFGHGIIDVTTRANLQVQGLDIAHLPEVRRRLEEVGLTSKQTGHDNIRNVFGHPYSGLLPDEIIDTRQLCHDVATLFLDSREYSDLPRKMNICFNGTDQHSAHFWTQDISFLATRDSEGEVLFQLLVGGTQGQNPHLAWHLPVLVRPDQTTDVTAALLDLFRAKGSRESRNTARFRFLVESLGVSGVLEWLEEELPYVLRPSITEPVPTSTYDDLIGWHRQSDPKKWTMGLSVPLGRISWQQLEGLAILSKKWGDGQLRTTHEQGIAVANIPTGFKDPAATDAAALGLGIHADPLERNIMACTGSQFCNIAVTETKGQMFQLMEKLRRKTLKLHGIRIHMSGCPSSCAQHFTADIGLKGVRVRRLLGTREGFDVYLGGGIAGQVHLGLPFRLGVDADQLPALVEEVISEYYRKHRHGQSFSTYWRDRLQAKEAVKLGDEDYRPPMWICEACDYQHIGEDPPVFCPSCAGLRRNFARWEEGVSPPPEASPTIPERDDGFVFAAKEADLVGGSGLTVQVAGQDYALFRFQGKIHALDSACPHEGAPLAEGEVSGDMVTCPWHGWRFNACSGCSLDPPGNDVRKYETKVEDGCIYLRPLNSANGAASPATKAALPAPREAVLPVLDVRDETPDAKTFCLDNSAGEIKLGLPGQFAKVCVDIGGETIWRSFTVSSSPTTPKRIELTIKRNPTGQVSRHLFDQARPGSALRIKGPQGGFCFQPDKHREPLALISAGSGVTPMMSIARFLQTTQSPLPCTFVHGAREAEDIIFREECKELAKAIPNFRYIVHLSRPDQDWPGEIGRVTPEAVARHVENLADCRFFLCGPHDFMDTLRAFLFESGVPPARIHTEQFHQRVSKPVLASS